METNQQIREDLETESVKKAISDIEKGYHTDFTKKMSLQALKKAIPMEAFREGLDGQDYVRCPVCKSILGCNECGDFYGEQSYCDQCGQALKF